MATNYRFIHLLYVPTMACNMACKYCYLEDNTKDEWSKYDVLETLEYAVNKFRDSKGYSLQHISSWSRSNNFI